MSLRGVMTLAMVGVMTRELTTEDVDEIVGVWRERAGGMDVQTCGTCGALVNAFWMSRLKHAGWHIQQGRVSLPGGV